MTNRFGKPLFSVVVAVLVLLLCLGATFFAWKEMKQREILHFETKFHLIATDVVRSIENRLREHEQILLGGAGLFDAKKQVSRNDWRTYVERLRLPERYPGILGVGYSTVILPDALPQHERTVKAEGFPEYHVRPVGARSVYTSIVYIEPFTGRNLAAFGFDMASEATRAKAMWMAADTGETIISGKVKLVQENKGKPQAGFLMYVPVYRDGVVPVTAEQKRAALIGFSYSPYRMGDLMSGLIGKAVDAVDFQIYDGENPSVDSMMYDSAEAEERTMPLKLADFQVAKTVSAFGRTWTIKLFQRAKLDEQESSKLSKVILGLGCGISFLMFFLVLILSRQRDVAMRLAEAMTQEIRDKNETLRLSQERFELAVQGTNDGIWDWNIVTDEVYYSPRMYELLGVSAGQLGTSLEAFMAYVHPDDQERLQTHVQNHLNDGGNYDLNYRVKVRRDDQDEWLWFNARGMAIRDENGKPIRMSGALTDITERHKAEQLKTEFVSTVSHELRTPLTSIGGTLSLIRGGVLGEVPVKMQAMLETAHKNSLRLGRLIDDLLDMEKLAAGKMQMNFCTLELMPLIEQALDANHSYAQRLQVSLRVSQRVDSAYVEVDPERLQQILSNLLSNAAKYSPTGDSVDISVVRIDGNLRVSIWDHGAGIPPEFHARIFQKFSQADSSDTREKGGTGLGLAITKELVDRMHGQISFTSKSGEGTCFYIDLQEVDATS